MTINEVLEIDYTYSLPKTQPPRVKTPLKLVYSDYIFDCQDKVYNVSVLIVIRQEMLLFTLGI